MFELPEVVVLARQINETLRGKVIRQGCQGNSPHKFVWYNRTHAEFEELIRGKQIGEALARGRWLCIPVEPGYVLVLGEFGGKILYHAPGMKLPSKYHLLLQFEDGSAFSVTTQMWGAMELFNQGEELNRDYIRGMRTLPTDPAFTFEYLDHFIDECAAQEKRSAKGLLTQDQLIPGLGNSIAQDILFRAEIHPRRSIAELSRGERKNLHRAILETLAEAIAKGGRYDETDLYGNPGGYVRQMDKNSAGKPCPVCGTKIESMQYLGGSCYYCPVCQK